MAQITPARQLFDLLVSRDFDPELLDTLGKPAADPGKAEIFSFNFRAESGKDYGTVVIMLSGSGDLEVYCADNVGKTMEEPDKSEWFAFLEQLKNFAVRTNRMNFGIKNLNHLRYSMQGQAAIKEGLFESWAGRKDISWNAGPNESRLMIKHKRNLGEDEARFRYVESLFIETADGERYKLPFRNLTAGKAMLEHVRNGGRPYDMRGQHIAEMINELTVLSRFRRANAGKLLEGDTATLVEQTNAYYENLQRSLKSLTNGRGYNTYFESWTPLEVSEESVVIEGLKHLFVTQSIDQRIEDALPLIAKIQQQENAMKEANIFEAWANNLMEGTWQTPDTPEKQTKLVELLSQDLPVGADATNATEQLYDLLGDDKLFDQLEELAQRDANADARQVVLDRMQELDQDPDVMKVITSLNIDATAEMNPPEQTPADLEPTQEAVKDPATQTEDPEGTAQPAYPEYQDDLASILKTAGVPAKERPAPDYELEEGGEGTTGQIIKKLLDPLSQGLAGGGKSLSIPLVGEEETDEGVLGTVGGAMGGGMLGTLAGGALGGMLGGPAGAVLGATAGQGIGTAAGAVGGQELTKGGSGIIEDNKEDKDDGSALPALAAGALGAGLGYAAGSYVPSGSVDVDMVSPNIGSGNSAPLKGADSILEKDELDTIRKHAGLGEKDMDEGSLKDIDWKEVAGSTAGGTAGYMAGSAIGGPIAGLAAAGLGSAVGGALAKDDQKTTEGVRGALAGGAVGGIATRSAKGAMAGAKLGSAVQDRFAKKEETNESDASLFDDATCNMTEAGENCSVHGMEECWGSDSSPLAGQYGHSGKMKEVGKDSSFLDRLKELSGMIRN
jgi:hypothetical protein